MIFWQIVFKFFDSNSECFAKYETFCSHIFITGIKKVRNYRKIVCIENIFENGWWEDAYPSSYSYPLPIPTPSAYSYPILSLCLFLSHPIPTPSYILFLPHPIPDSPMAISYRSHQKNLPYVSHLAPLVLFLFILKG